MKNIAALIVLTLLIVSCGPSNQQIEAAIKQTQVAAAEATQKVPTATAQATATKTPEPKPTATDKNDGARIQFKEATSRVLNQMNEVDSIKTVTFNNGVMEVEFITTSSEKAEQPGHAFGAAFAMSVFLTEYSPLELETLAKGKPFILKLIAVSKDGRYRYVTETNYETLQKFMEVTKKPNAISLDSWIMSSKGRFE